jgi:hypothetical protein
MRQLAAPSDLKPSPGPTKSARHREHSTVYNFLIASGLSLAAGAVSGLALGGLVYGIIPALLLLVGSYFLLLRRSIKQVEGISAQVGQIMATADKQSRAQARNQRAAKQSIERAVDQAISTLRTGYPIGQWQWGVRSQLDAQIGNLLFTSQRFKEAKPYLKTGFARLWTTRAMLGVCMYREQKFKEMNAAFDEAIQYNRKKQGLLYATYAWCVLSAKDGRSGDERRDEALDILTRGNSAMDGKDPMLGRNLDAVRNGKKMVMSGYGQQWYMFHLETMKMPRQAVRGR